MITQQMKERKHILHEAVTQGLVTGHGVNRDIGRYSYWRCSISWDGCLVCRWLLYKSGPTEIILFKCISAIWDQYSAFFTSPRAPQCSPQGVAATWWLHDSRYCSSWASSGLRNSHLEGWNGWWLGHPCLLILQEMLYFSVVSQVSLPPAIV